MAGGTTAHATAGHAVDNPCGEVWYPKVVVIASGDVLHVVYSGGTCSLMCQKNNAWRDPEYREHEPDCISGEKR